MGSVDDWDELAPPELRPVPEQDKVTHRWLIAIGAALGTMLLIGLVVWAVAFEGGSEQTGRGAPGDPNTVTESFVASGPAGADTSTVVSSELPAEVTGTATAGLVRRLAYRVGADLWVADEAGGHALKLVASSAGPFALSPDGRTLAFVDAAAKRLALVDVSSSRVTTVGPAEISKPVWALTSTWLAYVANDGVKNEVRRCSQDGRQQAVLGAGDRPAIAPDGSTYAYVSDIKTLMLSRRGAQPERVAVEGRIDAIALTGDRVIYSLGGATAADLSIRSSRFDGGDRRTLVGATTEPKAGRYDDLVPAPSGSWLVYAMVGDDGFSKMHAVHLDGSGDTPLSRYYSDYPLTWSRDSTRVFFFEGNADQGQAVRLISARPDGTQRETVVQSAGR